MDWEKLKAEYLQGGISYRQLAAKYNVSLKTLSRRAKEGQWQQHRLQVDNKVATDLDAIITSRIEAGAAKVDLSVYDAAQELLELTMSSMMALGRKGPLMPQALSQYASAIRSIQMAMQRPTELDMEEQKARIAKLQRDAEINSSQAIIVQLEGDIAEYGD